MMLDVEPRRLFQGTEIAEDPTRFGIFGGGGIQGLPRGFEEFERASVDGSIEVGEFKKAELAVMKLSGDALRFCPGSFGIREVKALPVAVGMAKSDGIKGTIPVNGFVNFHRDIPPLLTVKATLVISSSRGDFVMQASCIQAHYPGAPVKHWQRVRDLNPCTSLERAVS